MQISITRLILPLLLLTACAKKPISSSYWEGAKAGDDVHITYFDNAHKISCTVTNDSTNLYVQLETNNKSIQREILRQGATVYIDTAAKHSQKMYLRYPSEGVIFNKKEKNKSESEQGFHDNYKESNRMIAGLPPTLVWNNGTGEQVSNFAVEKTGLKAKMYVDSMGYTIYKINIPLVYISKKGFNKATPFSVGIKIEAGVQNGNRPDAGGGFAGGAGFAGAGNMSGRGARMNGGGQSGSMPTSTSIWFVTKLSRKQ